MSDKEPQRINLDYAPPRRRWMTRRRVALIILFLAIAGAAWRWGPATWRQGRLLYLQSRCAQYTAPADRVIYDDDPVAADALINSGGAYRPMNLGSFDGATSPTDTPHVAVNVPRVWDQYWRAVPFPQPLRIHIPELPWAPSGAAVVFLHKRESPAGNQRLLCIVFYARVLQDKGITNVKYYIRPYVVEEAGWTTRASVRGKTAIRVLDAGAAPQPTTIRAYGGQVDPKNASRFNFRVNAWGIDSIIDVQLENDDSILVVPRGRLHAPTTKQK